MKIPIDVSADRAEPMYHQIREQLKALILSGQLAEGLLLPSIREFAADLSCSIITIRRVYQDLEQEGLLRTRQGMGTFVAKVSDSERDAYRRHAVYEALKAAVEIAGRIRCSADEMREMLEELLRDYPREGSGRSGTNH